MSTDGSTLPGLHIDKTVLTDALASLGDAADADVGTDEALQRVVSATQAVFNVTGAGLMLVDPSSVLRYVVASDEPSRQLETAQEDVGTGPCVEALVLDRVISTDDLATDDRWPAISERVVPHGVRAVLGLPIRLAGGPVGSLNVYADEPHEWDDSERDAIASFGRVVEDLLGAAVLMHRSNAVVDQLQYALDHRVQIERAVGVVMGSQGVDAVAAFNLLRDKARARRIRVAEVAEEVLRHGA